MVVIIEILMSGFRTKVNNFIYLILCFHLESSLQEHIVSVQLDSEFSEKNYNLFFWIEKFGDLYRVR